MANVCQWVSQHGQLYGQRYFDVNGNTVPSLSQDVCGKRVASWLRFSDTTAAFRIVQGWIDQVMKLNDDAAEILEQAKNDSLVKVVV